MMISFENNADLFQYRAACIILNHNKILLQRVESNDRWFLPGGRVEFGETAEQTIEREMIEEFGVQIVEKKLVWVLENLLEFPDNRVHELGMYFVVKLQEEHPILRQEGEFLGIEDGFVHRWVNLDDLDEFQIVPEFVTPELRALDPAAGIKHVINRAVRNYAIT